jgi:hypothetical protein
MPIEPSPAQEMAARLVVGQIGGEAVRVEPDQRRDYDYEIRGARWVVALAVTTAVVEEGMESASGAASSGRPTPTPTPTAPRTWRSRFLGPRPGPRSAGAPGPVGLSHAVEGAALEQAGRLVRAKGVKGRHLFVWLTWSGSSVAATSTTLQPPFDGPDLPAGVDVAWAAPWEAGSVPLWLWCASPDWELPKEPLLGPLPQ